MQNEIEAKFLNVDKVYIRERMTALGFTLTKKETLMRRKAFHFKSDLEENRQRWARVRDEGDKVTMCVKEITDYDSINGVLESEVEIDNFEMGTFLLKGLGMDETAYQENYREIWEIFDEPTQSKIEVMIDSWPHIKPYIEIESKESKAVERCAKLLGYNIEDAFYGGVDVVYKNEHGISKERIRRVPFITFETPFKELL